jgi:hypothetical protein
MDLCKITPPPPGQDINEYVARLVDTLTLLERSSDKRPAIERLDLMIASIREIIKQNKPARNNLKS